MLQGVTTSSLKSLKRSHCFAVLLLVLFADEEAPWVSAVVMFVVLMLAVALVVVTVLHRKKISHFLCPKDALPQHFKEVCMLGFGCVCND